MDVEQLHKDILSALPNDPIGSACMSDPPDDRWSMDNSGFLCCDNHIYVPESNDLRLRVLQNTHDHPLSGHFGQNCTLELIRREYTWPGICTYVKDYIKSCTTCARAKVLRHKPFGLLKQLPIPERPWNSISMDFIEQLPDSSGYTAIHIIIDCLSKQAIFVPTHNTITSPDLARLFLLHVFSKHRIPSHVTLDQGTEFVSHFFHSLGKHSIWSSTSHPDIIWKEMDKQNEPTKP